MLEDLVAYHRCVKRIHAKWPEFVKRRQQRLQQQARLGTAAEKVTENIVEDLVTIVLDWDLADLNNQVDWADIVLTTLGIKRLLIETKRPGALAWHRAAVDQALDQACRYAAEQHVKCIAVSDGSILYAADVADGGLHDRVFVTLDSGEPQTDLWWLSVHGIYRPRMDDGGAALQLLPLIPKAEQVAQETPATAALTHPKYKLPARCFAYVGDASRPNTWKLPYCVADGSVDSARLPKAIQAILSNYRGARVGGIPEQHIPAVLLRLARAAEAAGRMPPAAAAPAPIYQQLADVLEQLGIQKNVAGAG